MVCSKNSSNFVVTNIQLKKELFEVCDIWKKHYLVFNKGWLMYDEVLISIKKISNISIFIESSTIYIRYLTKKLSWHILYKILYSKMYKP